MDKPSVYLLHHVHEWEDGHEDAKLIGVFSSQAKAQAALDTVRNQPGFRDTPDGFDISEYRVDSNHIGWAEGYVTIRPGEYLPDDKAFREYISDFGSMGGDIYSECALCGSACPTTGISKDSPWQCSCGNLSILNAQRTAKGGNATIKVFRLK